MKILFVVNRVGESPRSKWLENLYVGLMIGFALLSGTAGAGEQPDRVWTLEALVSSALENNAALAAAQSASDVAREGIAAARGARLPRSDAVALGEYFPSRDKVLISRAGGPEQGNPFTDSVANYGLELSLPLYTSGRIEHGIAQAEAQADAARQRIEANRYTLLFHVAAAYYKALHLGQIILAQEAALTSLRESRRLAGLQQRVGRIARLDLLRIETRLAQGERDLAGVRSAHGRELETLKALAALPAEEAIAVAGELGEAARSAHDIVVLRSKALDQRPDLQALRAAVRARRQAVGVAEAREGLTVELKAGYRGVSDFDGSSREDSALFLGFRMPIYSGGVLGAQRRRELARLREAEYRLEDAERQALADVERAWLDLEASFSRIEAGRRALTQAEESLRIEQEKLATGRGISNDLLLAEEALLRARTELTAALADSHIALAALRLGIGEPPLPIPVPGSSAGRMSR